MSATDRPTGNLRTYVGDGVYVEFDGYGHTLFTERHPKLSPDWIYLEHNVLMDLLAVVGSNLGGTFTFATDSDAGTNAG